MALEEMSGDHQVFRGLSSWMSTKKLTLHYFIYLFIFGNSTTQKGKHQSLYHSSSHGNPSVGYWDIQVWTKWWTNKQTDNVQLIRMQWGNMWDTVVACCWEYKDAFYHTFLCTGGNWKLLFSLKMFDVCTCKIPALGPNPRHNNRSVKCIFLSVRGPQDCIFFKAPH